MIKKWKIIFALKNLVTAILLLSLYIHLGYCSPDKFGHPTRGDLKNHPKFRMV